MPKTKISTVSGIYVNESIQTPVNGLSSSEVERRRAEYGMNEIIDKEEKGIVFEFFSHFKNPLIIILFFAAGISLYVGDRLNAVIITVMILAGVILDFFEEHSANKAAAALRQKVGKKCTVIRSGVSQDIPTSEVCLGDLLFLSAGDLVPADARIIEANDFFVNQSALTGESFPLEKTVTPAACGTPTTQCGNIVLLGSNVVSGSARCVVFQIGKNTEFAKVAQSILKQSPKSEFEIGVEQFGFLIMKVTMFLILAVFLFTAVGRGNMLESFIFAIAIAVGITPELLPVVMSVTMARGSQRMARAGVIVKKLSSLPNFGSMDVLCTDKTGTLTEDNIRLIRHVDWRSRESEHVFLYTYLNSFFQTGVKNPLDKAVLNHKKARISNYTKIEEVPFDFTRRMMSIVVERGGSRVLITKGAPESVMAKCTRYSDSGGEQGIALSRARKKSIAALYEDLSAQGYRVLAVAIKKDIVSKKRYTCRDENALTFCGFAAFLDPPKTDVAKTLRRIQERGVQIKVITGDNELVARKICSDVGLTISGVITGSAVRSMDNAQLRESVETANIFARFAPDEKNRVIAALRSNGHVVGYLGDGINDAPSLKTSDVGISVENAVDVAKESADIILTHKSLTPIIEGIIEGRKAFANTIKYVMMGLSSNFGNMFSVVGAVLYLPFLPMKPIQILLNNFLYDLSQISIPSDNVDREWTMKPRKWDIAFIKKFMYSFGAVSSLFDFLTFFLLFSVFRASESVFQTAWFMESLATQTLVIHIIRTKKIPFLQSRASSCVTISIFIIVLMAWILPFTAAGSYLGFTPLPPNILGAVALLVVGYLVIVEIFKRFFYKRTGFMV